jgi:hypothetical protein
MRRYENYKNCLGNYNFYFLFEAVINPEDYLNEINETINKIYFLLKKLKFNDKKLVSKITNLLTTFFKKNKIEFIFQSWIEDGDDIFIEYGLNGGATKANGKIGIFCNENLFKILDKNFFDAFKVYFLKILKHELIHRGQALRIKDNKIKIQILEKDFKNDFEYLKHPQEMMARAWDIVEVYRSIGYSSNEILNILKNRSKEKGFSNTLLVYHKVFKEYPQVLKLLYKYMYMYLT